MPSQYDLKLGRAGEAIRGGLLNFLEGGAPIRSGFAGLLRGDVEPLKQAVGYGQPFPQLTPEQMQQQSLDVAMDINNPMQNIGGILGVVKNTRIGDIGFDPRYDPRKLEQEKLNNLVVSVDVPETNPNIVSLANYEGYPFITSMSDRTNVGQLQAINNVPLNVDLQGGQSYMFNNPGQVWASAKNPTSAILKNAEYLKNITGKDPLYLPWRMAPTGGDFANMTGETMLQYIKSNMPKSIQRDVNKDIQKFIPNFKGVGSEEGINQFRNAKDSVRKNIKNMLDKNYRDMGGLSIGEARLAVSDPEQLIAPDSGLQNVGQIFADMPIIQSSGHKAYPKGVPGQGLGILDKDLRVFELLPNAAQARKIIDTRNPSTTDVRALQMKPYAGILTSDILKSIGY